MTITFPGAGLLRGWSLGAQVGDYVLNRHTGGVCRVLAADGVAVTARPITEREFRSAAAASMPQYGLFYPHADPP